MRNPNAIALWVCGAAALAAGASCRPGAEPLRPPMPPPTVNGVPATPLSELGDDRPVEARTLVIRHRLVTLQLPLGTASQTEEIWSYVNEEPTGARLGACLARNGMRIGLGRERDWPEIARILRRLTGQPLARGQLIARPGHPAAVALKKGQPVQTIFTFRLDGTLVGRDYPAGDNLLVLTAGVDFDAPRNVLLTGAPVVRSTRRRTRYVKGEAGYVLASKPIHHRLEELAFRLSVAPGGFVMVGPGREVARATSPGNRFLVHRQEGERFETVLVIAPEVFLAPARVRE